MTDNGRMEEITFQDREFRNIVNYSTSLRAIKEMA